MSNDARLALINAALTGPMRLSQGQTRRVQIPQSSSEEIATNPSKSILPIAVRVQAIPGAVAPRIVLSGSNRGAQSVQGNPTFDLAAGAHVELLMPGESIAAAPADATNVEFLVTTAKPASSDALAEALAREERRGGNEGGVCGV